jgi:hypothetical protein
MQKWIPVRIPPAKVIKPEFLFGISIVLYTIRIDTGQNNMCADDKNKPG